METYINCVKTQCNCRALDLSNTLCGECVHSFKANSVKTHGFFLQKRVIRYRATISRNIIRLDELGTPKKEVGRG